MFQRRSGVNFTNVLRAAFALVDPKSAKKTVKLSSFFALLGSTSVKAARRTLVKLNPDELLCRKANIFLQRVELRSIRAGIHV